LRVLVVTNLFPPQEFGGYGRKLWEFTAELRRRGHDIKVLTVDAPTLARPGIVGTDDLEPMVERSLVLYGVWQDGTAYMHEDPAVRTAVMALNDERILQAAAAFAADVCLAGNIDLLTNSFMAALCARRVPVIHCVGNQNPGYPPDRAPRSPLFRLGPASGWVAGKLDREGYAETPKTVLYPGGRVDNFYQPVPPAYDRLRIAFASLITPYKGPHILANALTILNHNGVDFECEIAGDAPDEKFAVSLRDFCARFGGRVRFPGFLDRRGMAALFDRCNVLAFPSVFEEPFGITQVEAMAAGLAVISSGSGGSGEIVRHAVDGLIAPPGDAQALANALAGLPADRKRWEALARRGQARALSFTVARTVDRIEATFAELLAAR
jgi:glycosyltransferase involved in cell wall biosynthesis